MVLEAPRGRATLPVFDAGWLVDGRPAPFLSYAESGDLNWSDELESSMRRRAVRT